MKRAHQHFFLLALLFIGCALLRFPAAVAVAFLPKAIALDGSEGSLWEGRASALGWMGSIVQQDIRWSFRPDGLWHGQLRWDVRGQLGEEKSQLQLRAGLSDFGLYDAHLTLPAESFLAAEARLKPLRLGGLLRINAPRLALKSGAEIQAAEISVQLESLFSSLLPALGKLGSATLKLTLENQLWHWRVLPLQGQLLISGTGALSLHKQALQGELILQPEKALAARLQPLLPMLQKEGEDKYRLTFN